jgi:hypothetical protein
MGQADLEEEMVCSEPRTLRQFKLFQARDRLEAIVEGNVARVHEVTGFFFYSCYLRIRCIHCPYFHSMERHGRSLRADAVGLRNSGLVRFPFTWICLAVARINMTGNNMKYGHQMYILQGDMEEVCKWMHMLDEVEDFSRSCEV